jgi:Proteins of 100 residues with WXG
MSDVFSSQDALNLLASDPDEVASLAAAFRTVANQSETAINALQGAHGDLDWTGAAADAFRQQLGKLPADLAKVHQSYGEVATVLDGYGNDLGPIRSRFISLQNEYDSLQSSLTTAQGNVTSAQGSLSTAKQAPKATSSTPAVANAHAAVSNAQAAASRLQDQISSIEHQGSTLLAQFDTARSHAVSTVSSAQGLAPEHHWWQSALAAVGNFMSGVGHVALTLVKQVGKAAEALPSDVANVVLHPTNLHDWSKLGEDAGMVAGAVALVAAVVVFPADAAGLDAVVTGVEAIGDGAETAGTVAGLVKTDADAHLAEDGQGSWKTVAFDSVGDVVGQVKAPGLGDAETDVTHLAGKSKALDEFTDGTESGLSAKAARAALNPKDSKFLTTSIKDLSNPAKVKYMASSTEESLQTAESLEHKLNLQNQIGHTVYDKGSDAVKDKVDPAPAGG